MISDNFRYRFGFISFLLIFSVLAIVNPVDPTLSTGLMFEDEANNRINEERTTIEKSDLVVRISHDDGGQLSSNLTRVQELISIENILLNEKNSEFSWISKDAWIVDIQSPYSSWSAAFNDSGRNIENATRWGEILQPEIEGGWCSENSTKKHISNTSENPPGKKGRKKSG